MRLSALRWTMLDKPSYRPDAPDAAFAAPLVMLPGTVSDARLFAPVLTRLGLRAIVPQLAGADTASALAMLLLARLPDRFSLCGFSLGAIVALEIVAQAPERVERLALIGCNPGVLSPQARALRAALSRRDFTSAGDPAVVRAMADDVSDATWQQHTAITLSRADSLPRLSRIAVPTSIICGSGDLICPPAMSRAMAAAIPGARLALIEDAGHYVTLEQPQAVADEIAAWLATPANSTH
jgi:pimeloyl-ACP methyl ester carboxylesterase